VKGRFVRILIVCAEGTDAAPCDKPVHDTAFQYVVGTGEVMSALATDLFSELMKEKNFVMTEEEKEQMRLEAVRLAAEQGSFSTWAKNEDQEIL
jgi:hypothetical protein